MNLIGKNKTKSDCGIVAAYNASKWCNLAVAYDEVRKLASSCGYSETSGIYHFQFLRLIKKLELPHQRLKPKSVEELELEILNGKYVIFLYTPTGSARGHAVSAFLDHRGEVTLVNPWREHRSWNAFVTDLEETGTINFYAYAIPSRDKKV